jgi:hypothetical protein
MQNFQLVDFIEDINEQVTEFVHKNFNEVSSESLGLDPRAGRRLWINETGIAVKGGTRNLDYYGGFEYVDQSDRRSLGDWTFYMIEEDGGRIRDHLAKVFPELQREEDRDE